MASSYRAVIWLFLAAFGICLMVIVFLHHAREEGDVVKRETSGYGVNAPAPQPEFQVPIEPAPAPSIELAPAPPAALPPPEPPAAVLAPNESPAPPVQSERPAVAVPMPRARPNATRASGATRRARVGGKRIGTVDQVLKEKPKPKAKDQSRYMQAAPGIDERTSYPWWQPSPH